MKSESKNDMIGRKEDMGDKNLNDSSGVEVELTDLFAQFWLRHSLPSAFVDWAVQELVRGKDSPNLRILAGLSGDDRSEVMLYLERALQELKVKWPEHRSCLLQYCRRVARRIVAGKITPGEGYNLIYEVILELEYPRELRGWLEIEMDFYRFEGADDETKQVELIIVEEAKRFVVKS